MLGYLVTGREREFAHLKHDGAGRTVAVVGGGPAGFTAAMVLQERGFHAVLFDKSPRLGGDCPMSLTKV